MIQRLKAATVVATARGILRGIIIKHAENWEIAMLVGMVTTGKGVHELVPTEFRQILAQQAEKYPPLKNITIETFLTWVQEGNPELFKQMVSQARIMEWLSTGWEAGLRELFRTENP